MSKSYNHISSSPSMSSSSSYNNLKENQQAYSSKTLDKDHYEDSYRNRRRNKSRDYDRYEDEFRDRDFSNLRENRDHSGKHSQKNSGKKSYNSGQSNKSSELASPPPPRNPNYQSSAAANILRKIKQYKQNQIDGNQNNLHNKNSSNLDDTPYTSTPSKSPRNLSGNTDNKIVKKNLNTQIDEAIITNITSDSKNNKFPLDVDLIETQDLVQIDKDKSITDSGVVIGSSTVPTTGKF